MWDRKSKGEVLNNDGRNGNGNSNTGHGHVHGNAMDLCDVNLTLLRGTGFGNIIAATI